jgi:hypothetical protein
MPDISALADLLADTLRDLPINQFEIALDQPQYPYCKILKDENISSRGGTSIQKNIVLNTHLGQANLRTMYETDTPIVGNAMNIINVPWSFLGANYSYDINELLMNKNDRAGFVDLIMERRQVALTQLALLLEQVGWGVPVSAGDTVTPYGMQYYFPFLKNGQASPTTKGFVANTIRYSNGTTGTLAAGIDASVFANWNAYGATYTRVDNALLRAIRSAIRQTHFDFPDFMEDPGDVNDKIDAAHGLYVNDTIMSELEDLLQKIGDGGVKTQLLQGVNVATDVDQKAYVEIDGVPVMYNPFLDSESVVNTAGNTVNPNSILCVRWNAIRPTVLEDMWNHESLPMADRGQHTTLTVYWDSTFNNVVVDRRRAGFRIHNPL